MSLAIDHNSGHSAEAAGLKASRRELPSPKCETHQLFRSWQRCAQCMKQPHSFALPWGLALAYNNACV